MKHSDLRQFIPKEVRVLLTEEKVVTLPIRKAENDMLSFTDKQKKERETQRNKILKDLKKKAEGLVKGKFAKATALNRLTGATRDVEGTIENVNTECTGEYTNSDMYAVALDFDVGYTAYLGVDNATVTTLPDKKRVKLPIVVSEQQMESFLSKQESTKDNKRKALLRDLKKKIESVVKGKHVKGVATNIFGSSKLVDGVVSGVEVDYTTSVTTGDSYSAILELESGATIYLDGYDGPGSIVTIL